MPSPWNKGSASSDPAANATHIDQLRERFDQLNQKVSELESVTRGRPGDSTFGGLIATVTKLADNQARQSEDIQRLTDTVVLLTKSKVESAKDENGDDISFKSLYLEVRSLKLMLSRALWRSRLSGEAACSRMGRRSSNFGMSRFRILAIIACLLVFAAGMLQIELTARAANQHICDQARREKWVEATVEWATELGVAVELRHRHKLTVVQYFDRASKAYSVYIPKLRAYRDTKCL